MEQGSTTLSASDGGGGGYGLVVLWIVISCIIAPLRSNIVNVAKHSITLDYKTMSSFSFTID